MLHAAGMSEYFWQWIEWATEQEKPSEDVHGAIRRELEIVGEAHRYRVSNAGRRSPTAQGAASHLGRSISPCSFHGGFAHCHQAGKTRRQAYYHLSVGPLTELLTRPRRRVEVLVNDLLLPANSPKPLAGVVKPLLERAGEQGTFPIFLPPLRRTRIPGINSNSGSCSTITIRSGWMTSGSPWHGRR